MFLQHRIGLLIVQPVWPRVAEQSTVFNLNDVETLLLTFYRGQARVTRRIVLVRFDFFKNQIPFLYTCIFQKHDNRRKSNV